MLDHIWELAGIVGAVGGALLGAIIWFVKRDRAQIDDHTKSNRSKIERNRDRIDAMEDTIHNVERNYIKRFEGVHQHLHDLEIRLMEKITAELRVCQAQRVTAEKLAAAIKETKRDDG